MDPSYAVFGLELDEDDHVKVCTAHAEVNTHIFVVLLCCAGMEGSP